MLKIISLAFIVWSFFGPIIASTIFISFFVILEGWLLLVHFSNKPKYNLRYFTPSELKVLKKYHLYFRYPFSSKSFSSTVSGIQLSAFIFVPWLLFNKIWMQAIIIGINYFIAGKIAVKLNPRFFLHDAVDNHGAMEFTDEMNAVDSVCEKIINISKNRTDH